jgi:hypothetical protein
MSSCSSESAELNDDQRIAFLSKHNVKVDTTRPYYSSSGKVPVIFSTVWQIRNIMSKSTLNIDLSKYKGNQCSIVMYPVSKLPFTPKNSSSAEARDVVISCKKDIICSYVEYISELRSIAPTTLDGKSVADISGVSWDKWKEGMDSDDNKSLVIYQYYNALRTGDYGEAYTYIYDRSKIKEEDFIKTAKQNSLPYMDFLNVDQYKEPTKNECYYLVEANVGGGSKNKKTFEIIFDLKKDPNSADYGGWKIYKTQIK